LSDIRANTISDAAGTGPIDLYKQSAAKMYVHIDQATPTIQKSMNVSSITDHSTSSTTTSYANGFSDALYVTTYGCREGLGENDGRMVLGSTNGGYYASGSQRCYGGYVNATTGGVGASSLDYMFLVSHGDLA
jgi:hypothetical protein